MLRDFALLEWLGANSFRTSHYPYAEEVLASGRSEGIVVIDEVPAVGMNSWNKSRTLVRARTSCRSETLEHHLQCIRELVARDRNHPSVVMWSVANEASTYEPASRPTSSAASSCSASSTTARSRCRRARNPDECQVQDLLDVVSLNRYYGWYENTA